MEGAAGVGVRVQAVKGDASLLPVQLRYSYMEAPGSATSKPTQDNYINLSLMLLL